MSLHEKSIVIKINEIDEKVETKRCRFILILTEHDYFATPFHSLIPSVQVQSESQRLICISFKHF